MAHALRLTPAELARMPRYRHLVEAVAGGAKPSKYRNERTVTEDGGFDSRREAARYAQLKLLEKAGHITAIARQVRFALTLITLDGPRKIETYVADFVYFDIASRAWRCEDSKGFRTADFIRKKRLMRELYGIEVIET